MPSAPGVSSSRESTILAEQAALKARKKTQDADYAERREKEKAAAKERQREVQKYRERVDPGTVEDVLLGGEVEKEWFKEGEWRPWWGGAEFDDDACLKNVTKEGKAKDGFFAPAGTILPLGAAFADMSVLKYGGYFPPGTSFPGGVMIPLHARMVNILPQETKDPRLRAEEGVCMIQ